MPEKTLDITQRLYQDKKCLSYPRTDSRVLGTQNLDMVKNIIKKLEELDDIETYDKAKKEKSDIISIDQAIIEIKNGK